MFYVMQFVLKCHSRITDDKDSFQCGKKTLKDIDYVVTFNSWYILSFFLLYRIDNDKDSFQCGKKTLCRVYPILKHTPVMLLYTVLRLLQQTQADARFMMPIYK